MSNKFQPNITPNMSVYRACDWYIAETIINRHLSRTPRTSFKILGWVCFIAQKWRDIVKIKKWKLTNKPCCHLIIFCECAITFLKQHTQCDRPFLPHFPIERQNDRFVQTSPQSETLLINTGLLIATVLCADIAIKLSLPKALGNFTISKVFFNSYWGYILHGRKLRWGPTLQPSAHII